MMENDNIVKVFSIDGIYGRLDNVYQLPKQTEEKISHSYYEINTHTGEYGDDMKSIYGLPNGITKNDYFNMALLKVLGEIRDELKKDSYVNIKPSSINITGEVNGETIKAMKAMIESHSKLINDSLKKFGVGNNSLSRGI